METTIKLSNGKFFNLLEDNFTFQDYHELSGTEIRDIGGLQEELMMEKSYGEAIKFYEETGILSGFY